MIFIPAVTPKADVTRFIPNTSAEYSAPFIIIFAIFKMGFTNKTNPETVKMIISKISTALIFFNLLLFNTPGKILS